MIAVVLSQAVVVVCCGCDRWYARGVCFCCFAVWWLGGMEEVARAEEGKVGGVMLTYLTAGGAGARAGNQAAAGIIFTVHVSREQRLFTAAHCPSADFKSRPHCLHNDNKSICLPFAYTSMFPIDCGDLYGKRGYS